MKPETAEQLTEAVRIVLNRNIDNRLTVDLATGIYNALSTAIHNLIEIPKEPATDSDSDTK